MRISELIEILEDIKKHHGDKFIWSQDDLDFPCPRNISLELTDKISKTSLGYKGGQAKDIDMVELCIDYQKNGKVKSWEF